MSIRDCCSSTRSKLRLRSRGRLRRGCGALRLGEGLRRLSGGLLGLFDLVPSGTHRGRRRARERLQLGVARDLRALQADASLHLELTPPPHDLAGPLREAALERRAALGPEELLEDLLAGIGACRQQLPEPALWEDDDLPELLRREAEEAVDDLVHVPDPRGEHRALAVGRRVRRLPERRLGLLEHES